MTSNDKPVERAPVRRRENKVLSKSQIVKPSAESAVVSRSSPRKAHPKHRHAPTKSAPRSNSKIETVLALLKRPGGVSIGALVKATEWQAHSVRGLLSGTISKRMGIKLTSVRSEAGERVYSVSA